MLPTDIVILAEDCIVFRHFIYFNLFFKPAVWLNESELVHFLSSPNPPLPFHIHWYEFSSSLSSIDIRTHFNCFTTTPVALFTHSQDRKFILNLIIYWLFFTLERQPNHYDLYYPSKVSLQKLLHCYSQYFTTFIFQWKQSFI